MSLVRRSLEPTRRPGQFNMVLHQYAVQKDSDANWRQHLSRSVEPGCGVNDVVGLPGPGRSSGVDQRRVLAVNRTRASIGVSLTLKRIQNLDFIAIHAKENSTVSPTLSLTMRGSWSCPFHVELAVTKILQCANVAAASDAFHVVVPR